MARRSILGEDDATEINLSPMIDCIFILLIFFIVTTVFVEEQGVQVNKPDAAAASTPEESENVTLEITVDSKVRLDGKEVSLPEVVALVKARVKEPETPVVIRVHEKARHGVFVSVWDAARQAGARAMSFSTVN